MHQNGATLPSPQEKCRRSGRVPGKPILPQPPLPALPPRGCGVGSRAGAAGRCSSRSRGCACPEHQVMGRNYRAHRPPPAPQCPPSRARPRGGRCRGSRGGGTCRGGSGGSGTAKAARCRPRGGSHSRRLPPLSAVVFLLRGLRNAMSTPLSLGKAASCAHCPRRDGGGTAGGLQRGHLWDCNRSPVGLQKGCLWVCNGSPRALQWVTCGSADVPVPCGAAVGSVLWGC